MAEILRMPEIAANTTEALVATWLVEPRRPFAAGDPLVTVETEKAAVDIEAESAGVLLRVLVPEGRQVEVGTPIAVWANEIEPDDRVDALIASLGSAVGSGTGQQHVADGGVTAAATDGAAQPPSSAVRLFSSPLARRIARDAGVDLREVAGTGPNGRIRRADVEAFVNRRPPAIPLTAATPAVPAAPAPAADHTDVPVSRMRQAIARRLTESKQTTPHFYLRGSARVDRLLQVRQEVNADGEVKVSVNDLIVKAVARAHTMVPALNVQWAGDAIRQFSTVDVAVAIATDEGLLTPVVRDVEGLSLRRLATTTRDLARRARERRITPAELDGGSITVTNLGMYGTEEFAAIINPPQAAILAVGAARPEPVVQDGALAVATVLRVTLAVDHRPVDGALAADWMRTFLGLLERPAGIFA